MLPAQAYADASSNLAVPEVGGSCDKLAQRVNGFGIELLADVRQTQKQDGRGWRERIKTHVTFYGGEPCRELTCEDQGLTISPVRKVGVVLEDLVPCRKRLLELPTEQLSIG